MKVRLNNSNSIITCVSLTNIFNPTSRRTYRITNLHLSKLIVLLNEVFILFWKPEVASIEHLALLHVISTVTESPYLRYLYIFMELYNLLGFVMVVLSGRCEEDARWTDLGLP